MKRVFAAFVLVLILLGLLIINAVSAHSATLPEQEKRTIVCDDGLRLYGWFRPGTDGSPLMVLLPMRSHTHTSYSQFENTLYEHLESIDQKERPHILGIDLRGHGLSVYRGNDTLSYSSMSNDEYMRMPADVATAIREIFKDSSLRIDTTQLIVVGASIGANTAIMLSELVPQANRVVALSPGSNYLGLGPADAAAGYSDKMLIWASEDDSYSAESSERLAKLNKGHIQLKVFSGTDHGTDIINNSPAAMSELLKWLYPD